MLFGVRPREVDNSGETLSDETIEIIDALRHSIEVVPSQYTNLLHVNVTSKDPRKAARIANAIVETYV